MHDLNYDDFLINWEKQYAIIRNLEIISEAAANVLEDLKEKYPDILWKKIEGMCNIISDDFFGIDFKIVWNTLINDIPILKTQIQTIIDDIEKLNINN